MFFHLLYYTSALKQRAERRQWNRIKDVEQDAILCVLRETQITQSSKDCVLYEILGFKDILKIFVRFWDFKIAQIFQRSLDCLRFARFFKIFEIFSKILET